MKTKAKKRVLALQHIANSKDGTWSNPLALSSLFSIGCDCPETPDRPDSAR